ncbi:GMC oxidoreductase [Leptodontidium sp. 2 PMI_412]|nr:GMC oxidoreductase [Leptodontidium sp. 2 PMI_412]
MRFSISLLAFAAGAWAQQSSSSVDPNTGITFQGKTDTTGFYFGMAVPTTVGSDFIGQMVAPITTGYGGLTLTGSMTGSLLVVAWPNAGEVVASFRETSGYTSPSLYTNASLSLSPIANGTFVNSTHMSYTFLCRECIMRNALTFKAETETIVVGWGFSKTAPTNPSSADSATFVYHEAGFGAFGLALNLAGSADYATWASMATTTSGGTGNATTPATGGSNSTCTTASPSVANSTYDYIVAGAGPAGIIAAQRLAETGKSVLLIERGQASTYATGGRSTVAWNDTVTQYDVPSMAYYLTTAADTTEYCTDTANMAGCLLGGGTMVNALMFVPPQDADFNDKWPTGWKWSKVGASAARLYERNPGTTLASEDQQRYDQGAFTVFSSFFKTLGWSQVDAIKEPNRKTAVYSYPAWDIQDGLRAGPVKSYLPLAKELSNFELILNTKVVRVIRSGSTATGVEVETSTGARQIINLNAGGNVVLASGSMSTPRILYNSGIGPFDQITTVQSGSACVTLPDEADWINLPVGQNLKDHPIFTLTFNTSSANSSMVAKDFTSPSQTNIDLFAKQSGPLVQSGQRVNFWTSLNTTSGTKFFQGTCNSPSAGTVRIKMYLTHGATSAGALGINAQGATVFTTDPWMNTDDDQTATATMIDQILNAAKNSTILKPADSTLTGTSMVAAKSYAQGSHFVGTTIMGETNDGSAVVDTNTKVFGTDNIFVVDASIHPDLPTGNTQAIVMVVAEHAAAKIIALGASSASNSTTTPTSSTAPYANTTIPQTGAVIPSASVSAVATPVPVVDEDDC